MVSEVRIYAEGGGDRKDTKAKLRRGLGHFFEPLRERARQGRAKWNIVVCGNNQSAFEDYQNALRTHPDAFNVLLIDSDGPVRAGLSPWEYIEQKFGWPKLDSDVEQGHFFVQVMETWFIADIETLRKYYGEGFNPNSIPRNADVEAIPKDQLLDGLEAATRRTKKGEYHKIKHAADLLGRINEEKVRKALYCDRIFTTILNKLNNNGY